MGHAAGRASRQALWQCAGGGGGGGPCCTHCSTGSRDKGAPLVTTCAHAGQGKAQRQGCFCTAGLVLHGRPSDHPSALHPLRRAEGLSTWQGVDGRMWRCLRSRLCSPSLPPFTAATCAEGLSTWQGVDASALWPGGGPMQFEQFAAWMDRRCARPCCAEHTTPSDSLNLLRVWGGASLFAVLACLPHQPGGPSVSCAAHVCDRWVRTYAAGEAASGGGGREWWWGGVGGGGGVQGEEWGLSEAGTAGEGRAHRA